VVSGAVVRPRGTGGGDADRGEVWRGLAGAAARIEAARARVRWARGDGAPVVQWARPGRASRHTARGRDVVGGQDCDLIGDLIGEKCDRYDRGIILLCLLPLMMGQARSQVATM
jgi:hypothetical protein